MDAYFERGELLKERGWYSFEPYWKFRESLCPPDAWELHRKYAVESMKEALGDYRSDLVARLRAERPGEEARGLTPCDRKLLELIEKGDSYDAAWRPFEEEQRRLRYKEIELHATAISRESPSEERWDRVRIWGEVVRERAGPLGFQAPASGKSYPASFRRPLGSGWGFVLGVDAPGLGSETADTVAKPPGMGPLPIGGHITWMALTPAGTTVGRVNPDAIFVPQYFVPFDRAYNNFWDLEGLEINVRAHMAALELLWPEMEPCLLEGVAALR